MRSTPSGLARAKATAPSVRHRALASGGAKLPDSVRARLEPRFGFDFSRVRIHADAPAAEALGARAFTAGEDIAFAPGQYGPAYPEGERLLAHELAHVVQQSRGGPYAPALDPGSALEHGARQAAAEVAQSGGRVAVAGASAPGPARDIFDVQERHDREDEEDRHKFIFLDPKHLPSFESEEWKRQIAAALDKGQQAVDHPSAKKPEPDKPAPVPPAAAKPADPPGDPQSITPTSPFVGYQGASNLDPGHFNLSTALGHTRAGWSQGLTLGGGITKFGELGGLAAVGSTSLDPSQNSTSSLYLNPFIAPDKDRYGFNRFNVGLYGGATIASGQRPSGSGLVVGPSGLLAGEALLGGASRDSPLVTLGANAGIGRLPYGQISAPGAPGATPPSTTLHPAWTGTGAFSMQVSPSYYPSSDAAGAEPSKTPRYTIFGEGAYAHSFGPGYSAGALSPGVPGSSTTWTAGGGIGANFRLDGGRYILSGGAAAGYRWEDDTVGNQSYRYNGAYGGLYLGGSWDSGKR